MKTREIMTVMKLLFFSLRLMAATIQPSAQESVRTKIVTRSINKMEPRIERNVTGATIQYTRIAGSITRQEYIAPIR